MPQPSPNVPASSPPSEVPELSTVLEEIARIAGAELELAGRAHPGARLVEDLALDSLGLTVLAVGLENRFRVKLDEQDAEGIVTVEDLARLVVRRAREGRG